MIRNLLTSALLLGLSAGCSPEVPFEALPKTDTALIRKYAEDSVRLFPGRHSGSPVIARDA